MKKLLDLFLIVVLMILILVTGAFAAAPKAESPKYGGSLTILERYPGINPIAWDNAAWAWKHPYDTGFYMEQLMVGDLQKGPRGTNEYDFLENSWIPHPVAKGELLEKWEVSKKPMKITFHLRKGVMWQDKPGVMKARELTADDVVSNFERMSKSPKALKSHWEFIDEWKVIDKYIFAIHLKKWDADWRYKLGWGVYSSIQAPEQDKAPGGANKWENATGTGPYMLTDYKDGHSQTYTKNQKYWDSDSIGGKKYQLPFTDKVVMMLIKDEATQVASFRTGKVDVMMNMDPRYIDDIKKANPEIKWKRALYGGNFSLVLRMDTKPFNDIRVRRALNLAVDKNAIIKTIYRGQAELQTYPYPANFKEIYTPLEKLSPAARELLTYNPEKAKKLLAEAGYPNGFSFKAQLSNASQTEMDVAAMVAAFLAKIGVNLELVPMDYPSWLSVMIKKAHQSALFMMNGHGSILAGLRKNFMTGSLWNPHMMSDPYFDKTFDTIEEDPNLSDTKAYAELKKLIVYTIEQAPAVILPQPYTYVAWWPWVKNYYGELRVGQQRSSPIWARVWIDQDLKKKMGY
ncbi:MAG: ABC transporter substrate-binding protein [Deltaproteobacteria bacterium]|nr:ABC transporter substrate-binding protein [Deltaproteobacteria bacterium]